ncbi:MAG: hypothetical protein AAGK14_14330 [Verrucomicrobiota bacterium]
MAEPLQGAGTLMGDHTVEADGAEPGNLSVEGGLEVDGVTDLKSSVGVGTAAGQPALTVTYSEAGVLYELLFSAYRAQTVFQWWDNLENAGSEVQKMALDGDNALRLFSITYTGSGTDGLIELKPAASGASTILVDGTPVVVADGTYAPSDLFGGASGSLAVGNGANTVGFVNAIALGEEVLVTADGQVVLGSFNKVRANDVLQVGNGVSGSPSNAMSVSRDGDLAVGRDLLVARNGVIKGTGAVLGPLYLEPASGLSMGAFTNGTLPGDAAATSVYDDDTLEYITQVEAVGAVITQAQSNRINELVLYLKEQDLWNHFTILLFLEGTGTTSYPLGGYTTATATLGSGAQFIAGGGLELDGTTGNPVTIHQSFEVKGTTVWASFQRDDLHVAGDQYIFWSGGRQLRINGYTFGDPWMVEAIKGGNHARWIDDGSDNDTNQKVITTQWTYAASSPLIWIDNTQRVLTQHTGGTVQFNSGTALLGRWYDGKLYSLAVHLEDIHPTDAQREWITDWMNAF